MLARNIFENLSAMEQGFIEADAAARGISTDAVVIELLHDALEFECMDEGSSTWDRQWKSH